MLNVSIRVTDGGAPTPVRLRITGPDGTYYAPLGCLSEFATGVGEEVGGNVLLGRERFCYIDGNCEAPLPDKVPLTVEIDKGPEYKPLRQEVTLSAGQLALRFALERWADWRARGWRSGDTRAHYLSPHAALLEGAAEDLAVVNLLAKPTYRPSQDGQNYPTVPNLLAFSGQSACVSRQGTLVAVNTHNSHPVLGHLGLLFAHRVVYPLGFGSPDATDDWTLHDWCHQCHRKRGLAVWTNFFTPAHDHDGEALADLLLGGIDAIEMPAGPKAAARLRDYYRLWNAGFGKPLVAGSGKDSNRTPLGALRTVAEVDNDSYLAWIDAVRAGRNFITNGPLIELMVDDRREETGFVHVRVQSRSYVPAEKLELLANGVVIASSAGKGSPWTAEIELDRAIEVSTWLAARVLGSQPSLLDRSSPVFAHTSPVVLKAGDAPPRSPADARWIAENLRRGREWVEREGRFDNPDSLDRLRGLFNGAEHLALAAAGE